MRFISLATFTVCVLAMQPTFAFAQAKKKPNIVVIFADDLGYADIGCYGGDSHSAYGRLLAFKNP